MEGPVEKAVTETKEAVVPTDEFLKAKWPELAKFYESKPRLANMLNTTTLDISSAEDGSKIVTFKVVNDAQKEWVESKLLHQLEGDFRKITGSLRVYVRVAVVPDDVQEEPKVYMPSDQAKLLMSQNEEVKSLVQDLELDIK